MCVLICAGVALALGEYTPSRQEREPGGGGESLRVPFILSLSG